MQFLDPSNSWIWWIVSLYSLDLLQICLFSNLVFRSSSQVSVTVSKTLFELAGTSVVNQPPLPANPISISIGHVDEIFKTIVYSFPGFMIDWSLDNSFVRIISLKFWFKLILKGKVFVAYVSHKSRHPISVMKISLLRIYESVLLNYQ